MKRSAWTIVALGSCLGSLAYAQGYDDQQPGQEPAPSDQAQPPSQPDQPAQPEEPMGVPPDVGAPSDMGTPPDTGAQPEPGAAEQPEQPQGAQDQQQSGRLSQLEAEGVELSALDENQIMELQRTLQTAGYYTAEVDGKAGKKTKQALSRFYRDQAQLAARGKILPQGAAAVGLDQTDIERVRGVEPEQPLEQEQQPTEPQQQPTEPQQQQQIQREGDSTRPPPSEGVPMEPHEGMQHTPQGSPEGAPPPDMPETTP